MPLPTPALLRGFPSPVPAQTMSGLGWKTAMAPMLPTGWSSKTGRQASPPSSDFHTPPLAEPTKMTLRFESTTSTSDTRPLIPAGPMERACMTEKCSGATFWPATGVATDNITDNY